MASYRQRQTANGIKWDIIFRIDGNQKLLCGYDSQEEAEQAYLNLFITYDYAMRKYLDYAKLTMKESTQYDIMNVKRKYLDVCFKGIMSNWTRKTVYDFIDYIFTFNYSNKHLRKIYQFFTAFYNWCRQRYELPNILDGVKLPKKPEMKFQYKIWKEADFNKFIEGLTKFRYICLFSTFFYTGLRCGELEALQVKDYDGESLSITKTYTRKIPEGKLTWKINEPKNYKYRRVPVPSKLKVLLDQYIVGRASDEYLFGGKVPISQNAIRTAFNKQIQLSGCTKIRIHDLRHSYVSMLMRKGVNFGVIASLIGDTIEQVVKTYAHTTEEEMFDAVKLL